MKKLILFLILNIFFLNNSFSNEYLDAFTLDKIEIEKNVMNSVSDEKIKFKSIKNWEGSFENYKITKPLSDFFIKNLKTKEIIIRKYFTKIVFLLCCQIYNQLLK